MQAGITDLYHMINPASAVTFVKTRMMKYFLTLIILLYSGVTGSAQENKTAPDSALYYSGFTKEECPDKLLIYINNDSLQSKAVLLVMNESLHPLGRSEFFDNGAKVHSLHIPMRMNRCTMLYIDTGFHQFHTIYQRLKVPVFYKAGKIYIARLFSRKVWPLGGVSIIKKNEKGEPVEYAAVLFEYINATTATEIYSRMSKKEIMMNE